MQPMGMFNQATVNMSVNKIMLAVSVFEPEQKVGER